ncbi:hypothetical protein BOTBODRAFT_186875 [Botryobasidium botryosum FD-172 SS1]|uniref:Uncharacterized protein n=1 Tax=Botryobasidium botryosum (strain FD-172 SS1) TaxID=930990 RepID=A0A067MVG2_BOTB1|nr:hypothetical protein BOTBODRAFT_186875 [Botryobasidium botryosum FD-172 SS1]
MPAHVPLTPPSLFQRYLSTAYSRLKDTHPGVGRRALRVQAAEEFWLLTPERRLSLEKETPQLELNDPSHPWISDPDPLDFDHVDTEGGIVKHVGILIRTDYTNDEAWKAFSTTLEQAEKDGLAALTEEMKDVEVGEEKGEESDEEEEGEEEEVAEAEAQGDAKPQGESSGGTADYSMEDTNTVDAKDNAFLALDLAPDFRDGFRNASNLTLLRLFNDVDIVPSPKLPQGAQRIRPPNRLVDRDGYQEVYDGRLIWVYDAQSNLDGSVRVVTGRGSIYGTASGDSWRAKGTHIWELQVSLDAGVMKIDFGGADCWTWEERKRNFAEVGIVAK